MKPGEVAKFFNVNLRTITRWADQGLLSSWRTPGGQRRYSRVEVERFTEAEREEGEPAGQESGEGITGLYWDNLGSQS